MYQLRVTILALFPILLSSFIPSIQNAKKISSYLLNTKLYSSASSPGESEIPNKSRLEGNFREPTAQEISIMDDMITKLSLAKPYELPNAVKQAFRVVSSPRFFLRIAERADTATSSEEKERLSALAANLVSTIDAVVSTAEDKLDEHAEQVQKILMAASEPETGEFLVPLSNERIFAMKSVINSMPSSSLQEGFLATIDSWMNKSMQDGLDGMVVILQRVLQLYAALEISRARKQLQMEVGAAIAGENKETVEDLISENDQSTPGSVLLEALLSTDSDSWEEKINVCIPSECSFPQLTNEVQKTMEGVVLGLENGSMAQRVQAEYLRELITRIENMEKNQ